MDPNANLKEQRALVAAIQLACDEGERPSWVDASRLADLVQALDEWCSRGGYLPENWSHEYRRKAVAISRRKP